METIQSFATASLSWLLPYVAVTTLTNWLECIEVVSSVSLIAAIWTVCVITPSTIGSGLPLSSAAEQCHCC